MTIGGGKQRLVLKSQHALSFCNIFAAEVMELRRGHFSLELIGADDRAEEGISRQQHLIVEEYVVNAHDAFFAQHDIARLRIASMHRKAKSEMSIVIKICARGDDPVNKSGFD